MIERLRERTDSTLRELDEILGECLEQAADFLGEDGEKTPGKFREELAKKPPA